MLIVALPLHNSHGNADSLVLTVTVTFYSLKLDFFCQREFSLENFILTQSERGSFPHLQMYFCVYTYIFFSRWSQTVGYWGAVFCVILISWKENQSLKRWNTLLNWQSSIQKPSIVLSFQNCWGKKHWKQRMKNESETAAVPVASEAGWGTKALTVHWEGLCTKEYDSHVRGNDLDV